MTLASSSASATLKQSGGFILRTLRCGPSVETRTPNSFMRAITSCAPSESGALVARSSTSSTPSSSPVPRTSPTRGCCACTCRSRSKAYAPVCRALCCSCSSSMTESTSRPTAHATGLPPNVLKYSNLLDASATSGVVITAASGKPLPNGLPTVTMSGTTPCGSKAHMCVPTRPKPVCTSSAMHSPPCARVSSCIPRRYPSGRETIPPQHMSDSTMYAAGGFSPEASAARYSASARSVASASLSPRRYVSGCESLTTPAGISEGEYLE
mmetsp:Transcript_39419/g.95764  ORF Transcript_39419/g.95764 Transcript_39419/m.95764 type:complete len:268 (+) Transcript_39419:685-1488(+)